MKTSRLLIILVAVFLATAVLAKVKVQYNKDIDFAQYKTYAWMQGTPASDPLMQRRIERTISAELQARGLKQMTGMPDIYVVTHAAVKERRHYSYVNLGYSNPLDQTQTATTVEIGTLRVELVDVRTKKVVWRSEATKAFSDNPAKNTRTIDKTTNKMFRDFPPKREHAGSGKQQNGGGY